MYKISEVADMLGLSRTTLLYYERIGLINSIRLNNGYRSYSEQDVHRLQLIGQLHAAGLTLKECQSCLDVKTDKTLLTARLQQLNEDIAIKLRAKKLLESMLGISTDRVWHHELEKTSPEAHLQWIYAQGSNEKDALRIRSLSKSYNAHSAYMDDFNQIFSSLVRLGPGSEADTLCALKNIPDKANTILEIGCGRGAATRVLVSHTDAQITAIDNELLFLQSLNDLLDRVTLCCASMCDLPFTFGVFDTIWAEGCAYIMGFNNALLAWKKYLKPNGYLVISEMVWLTSNPSEEARDYWTKNYPSMASVAQNQKLIKETGYILIESFEVSKDGWECYMGPLREQLNNLVHKLGHSLAWQDLNHELALHDACLGEYGYQFFIVQKMP